MSVTSKCESIRIVGVGLVPTPIFFLTKREFGAIIADVVVMRVFVEPYALRQQHRRLHKYVTQ